MIDQELVIGVKLHSLDHISQKSPLSAHTVFKNTFKNALFLAVISNTVCEFKSAWVERNLTWIPNYGCPSLLKSQIIWHARLTLFRIDEKRSL